MKVLAYILLLCVCVVLAAEEIKCKGEPPSSVASCIPPPPGTWQLVGKDVNAYPHIVESKVVSNGDLWMSSWTLVGDITVRAPKIAVGKSMYDNNTFGLILDNPIVNRYNKNQTAILVSNGTINWSAYGYAVRIYVKNVGKLSRHYPSYLVLACYREKIGYNPVVIFEQPYITSVRIQSGSGLRRPADYFCPSSDFSYTIYSLRSNEEKRSVTHKYVWLSLLIFGGCIVLCFIVVAILLFLLGRCMLHNSSYQELQ